MTNKNFMRKEIKTKINFTNVANVCSISLRLSVGRRGHPLGLGLPLGWVWGDMKFYVALGLSSHEFLLGLSVG